jgi:RNA-binding protein
LEPLTNPQKRRLKALSQKLDASLHVGKAGLSEAFLASLDIELGRHELVKVKFAEHKDAKHDLAPQLAVKTASHLVWIIGNVAVLYRQQAAPEKRRISF